MEEKIIADVLGEMHNAHQKWGTDFDDKNTANDWAAYLSIYLGQAVKIGASQEEFRKNMVKAAVIAVSAIASFDRNGGLPPRHYDK